ncbi:MAG: hypothetical protein AB7D43_08510, partial [Sulfurimonadaceae bacterium]
MARVIAIVTELSGKFFAKDAKGNIVELQKGDEIFEGMIVYGDSANGASDTINIHAYSGEEITLASNQEQLFDVTMVDAELVDLDSVIAEESIAAIIAENTPQKTQEEEEDDIFEEETAAGDEKAKKDAEVAGDFAAREGNMADVNSDLRDARFKVQSRTFEVKSQFEREDDGGIEAIQNRFGDTFVTMPRPTPITNPVPSPNITPEPNPNPNPNPNPLPIPEPTPIPVQTVVTLKLFAIDSLGNEVAANEASEGEIARYIVRAYDGLKEISLSGNVSVVFTPNGATSGVDFDATPKIVALGQAFNTDILDDFIADNGEKFTLAINPNTYNGSLNGYDLVDYDTTPVATTILDNSKPSTPNNTSDDTIEGTKDEVMIKLFAADSSGNVLKDGNGNYLDINEVYEGINGNYIAYAFKKEETSFNDSTRLDTQVGSVDVSFADGSASGVENSSSSSSTNGTEDYNKTSQKIKIGEAFSTETFIDSSIEGDETYTVTIDDNSYTSDTTNGGYESVEIDTSAVTTTIKDAKVFVKIEAIDNEVNESENLTYKVSIVNVNGDEVKVPTGKEIKVNLSYEGSSSNSATDGEDYDSSSVQTITISGGSSSTEFGVPTKDDYYAEGDEGLKITIDSIDNTSSAFDDIDLHATANDAPSDAITVIGTIKDNPAQDTVNSKTPSETGGYEDDDTVYVKIIDDASVVEGEDLVHHVQLVDKDGNAVVIPDGETLTVTLEYSNDTTEDGDYSNTREVTVTLDKNTQTDGNGIYKLPITNETIDDFMANENSDNSNESYKLSITNVAQSNNSFENVAIDLAHNSVTGEILDGVTLGTPENANVDEDTLVATDVNSKLQVTHSLNITAPNGDNEY